MVTSPDVDVVRDQGLAGPARVAAGTKVKWFVTAHTVRQQMVGGEFVAWPASTAHAKRMGMNVSACGIPTSTWRKLFALPFPVQRAANCRACSAFIAQELKR